MKSEYLPKSPAPGFSVSEYNKKTTKLGKDYKRKTKIVVHSGIQSSDQRSSQDYKTRSIPMAKSKPTQMTFGGTDKKGKGTTIYRTVKK